jgi:predicted component of type VI protein secretion system
MNSKIEVIWIIFLFTLLIGCGTSGQPQKPNEKISAVYLSNAQKAEARGDKIEALKQYKLVLTVNPDHQLANDKSIRIIQDLKNIS